MATTGFEDNIAALQDPPDWTTLGQETAYLSDLAIGNDTVAYERVGDTVQNRAMHLLRIGHPVAPTKEQAQSKPCILIIAKQHGNEYAGREAALIFARTLAEATGDLADLLESVCVIVMPNCNPDGGSRTNANGINLNRDHIQCTQPETWAMQGAIRDYRPVLVIDLHEANIDNDMEYSRAMVSAAPASIVSLSTTLIDDYIIPRCNSEGYDHAYYPPSGVGSTLSQTAGLRYAASLLVESDIGHESGREFRAQIHLNMLDAAVDFVSDEISALTSAAAAARLAKASEGLEGETPFDLLGTVIDPPPMGYALTENQLAESMRARDLHGIERIRPGIVSMGQTAQPVIPFLLDGRSPDSLISATPLTSGVPTAPELSGLSVSRNTPSVDCIESSGTVHFVTVEHGGDALDPFDVAQLIQHGAV